MKPKRLRPGWWEHIIDHWVAVSVLLLVYAVVVFSILFSILEW